MAYLLQVRKLRAAVSRWHTINALGGHQLRAALPLAGALAMIGRPIEMRLVHDAAALSVYLAWTRELGWHEPGNVGTKPPEGA